MQKFFVEFKRILGYIVGFLLFYEPFMFFGKLTSSFIVENNFYGLHIPCAKIPLTQIVSGEIFNGSMTSLFFLGLLILSALVFGPLFCGKLCPTGAFTQYMSYIVPEKFKVDWKKYVPFVPLRYGFGLGFLFSIYLGLETPWTFCNYYVFEMLMHGVHTGELLIYSTSLFLTLFLWFFILGIFSKGGRGYCNFLCPVGTLLSFMHNLGGFIPKTYRMHINEINCVGCGICEKTCPMRSITMNDRKAKINMHHCIICQ